MVVECEDDPRRVGRFLRRDGGTDVIPFTTETSRNAGRPESGHMIHGFSRLPFHHWSCGILLLVMARVPRYLSYCVSARRSSIELLLLEDHLNEID